MLRTSILISIFALCAGGLFAQDDTAQYQTWMKAAAGAQRAVRGAVTAKDNAAVAAQAKIMEENFGHISDFWTKLQKDDAVKLANTARDAAKTLGTATTPEDQTAAMQALGATCNACHQTYRDGSNIKK
jgi:cytochrome c556